MTGYPLTRLRCARRSKPNTVPSQLIRTVAIISTPDDRWRARLGYDEATVAGLPDNAVEAFAGVGNPFSLATLKPGSVWWISAPEAVSTALLQRVRSGLKVALLAST